MPDVNLTKLKKLFQEKRYSEAILDIESSTTENNRSPALHNPVSYTHLRAHET